MSQQPEPSRYILVPSRPDGLIRSRHAAAPGERAEDYRRCKCELLG